MNDEKQQMISLLSEIANLSMHGKIDWTQPTPSTFQWIRETDTGSLVVGIQRAFGSTSALRALTGGRAYDDADFLFQIQEMSPKRILVSLSSKERPELTGILSDIYASAERGVDRRANMIIERLLRG